MSESKMTELLAKLRELDPETAEEYARQLMIRADGEIVLIDANTTQGRYILQSVIQDAIVGRKWRIGAIVAYDEDDVPGWCIDVWPSYKLCRTSRAERPAEALLAAYIQALEAEAAR